MRTVRSSALCTAVILGLVSGLAEAQTPLGSVFTYQGQLKNGGSPANGLYDVHFRLYDAAMDGTQLGPVICYNNLNVADGLFTASLDFGNQFAGEERFLDIAIRVDTGLNCVDTSGFTTLSPRQRLTATPYALYALNAGAGDGHALDAADGDPVDALFVDNSGQVGIGTLSPATTLDLFRPLGDPQVGIGLQVGGSWKAEIAQTPASMLTFRNGGQDRMVLSSAGKVGIGTSAPDQTLHVHKGSAGSASGHTNAPLVVENSTHSYINILSPDASERGILFGDPASNIDGGVLYNSSTTPNSLQFRTGGNITRMVIDASGNIGIGTVSPVFPMHVETGSTAGRAVYGLASASSGTNYGVYGHTNSSGGYGIYSSGNAHIEGQLTWKTVTSYLSIPPAAFAPADEAYQYSQLGHKLTPGDSSSSTYYAPVSLPHGATVTKLTFHWNDTDGTSNASIWLDRSAFTGFVSTMASAASSGSGGNGSTTDSTVSNATVDNSQYEYILGLILPSTSTSLYGVVIEYAIDRPY